MIQAKRRQLILGAGAVAAGALNTRMSFAADPYPNKPIRWIVTFPAGGGADWMTRVITDKLGPLLGQTVIVDNRPGASGAIGLTQLAKAAPDGYTVGSGDMGSIAMTPSLTNNLAYDTAKDLQPVSLMIKAPWLLVINPERVPVANFKAFADHARKNPDKLTYASFGPGSITHVMTELLKRRANIDMLHVPYKGAAPAFQDLLGGQVDCMFIDYSTAKAHIATGRVRAIGAGNRARVSQMPELLSLEEGGVPDFDVVTWMGAMVPAGTPPSVVERLRAGLAEILRTPEVTQAFAERAIVPMSSTPAQFRQLISDDLARWSTVIKTAQIKLD